MSYAVAVRALCEFTAKQGDLDLRFTPSPSSQEGIAGHGIVASRRAETYQAEVSLAGQYRQLQVRGRADGYDPRKNRLEEIKTFRGELERMPDNHRHLHWAQLKIYGHLLCQKMALQETTLALVYFDVKSQKETVLQERWRADDLQLHFELQCERFLVWAEQEMAHRARRNDALGQLQFPHAAFRAGQRQLAEAVYRTAARADASARVLMAQAPTGIGKTVGTLFPLLKAAPTQQLDKVFYLAAKTPGRKLALDALAQIRSADPALPLRVIELVARDKACEHPDKACHGDSCPLAKGFYDRVAQARQAAVDACSASGVLDKDTLRSIGLRHQVCPYYLGQDLVRWCDVAVGDYNYYFDVSAMLHGLTTANEWRVSVLVDEAHNLVERGRKMYSAELGQAAFKSARRGAPPPLKKNLDRLNRSWNQLCKEQKSAYQAYAELPQKFMAALQQTSADIGDWMADNPAGVNDADAAGARNALQRFYFDALHFLRIADVFDGHFLFDLSLDEGALASTLCLRNVIPAPFLAQRFASAHSATLFSATLSPAVFYRDTLGIPENAAWLDVQSPFSADQLSVQLVSGVSTRYQHREASLLPIVSLMAQQFCERAGNYLVFASSFDYLEKMSALFRQRHPGIPTWEQSRGMEETEREQFLARFTETGAGFGFAVLGGAFSEGIDLPGRRLIGAFIATLGLPQINPVNEQMMQRMHAQFGAGYDYTYLFPGLQKVVQAAGRVIRTPSDRGVLYLIDDRYGRSEIRSLLPKWWQPKIS